MTFRHLAAGVVLTAAVLAPAGAASAASYDWVEQHDRDAGYRFAYPEAIFEPVAGEGRPSFRYFISEGSGSSDGERAKLVYGSWDREADETPDSLKRWMISNAGGEQGLTYEPNGRNWFVVSGYKGDQVYYQKVMFSCGGKKVSVFGIAYPTANRALYDPAVERMEDVFRPAGGC